MGFSAQHEAVTRRLERPAPFTLANVVYFVQPETGKKCFACVPLHASAMSIESCAAQYARGLASCSACEVGLAHAAATPGDFRLLVKSTPTESCIRCGRDGKDEHSKKIIGRFRTVQRTTMYLTKSSGKTTVCVNCFNRAQECRPGVMRNSKGATPVKHARFLRDTIIAYRLKGETIADVSIGLRASVNECRRLLERAYGKAAKLKAVRFEGEVADLRDTNDPLLASNRTPSQKNVSAVRSALPNQLPVATDAEAAIIEDDDQIIQRRVSASPAPRVDWDDWDTPLHNVGRASIEASTAAESTADGNGLARKNGWLPPLSEEEDAAYRTSFDQEETFADFGYPYDLADFAAWLCAEWPMFDRSPIVVKPTTARPALRYFSRPISEWANAWGVAPEVAAERLKDQLDDGAALQAMGDPVARPQIEDVREPDPLAVLDNEGVCIECRPSAPSAAVAEPEALPEVAQAVRQPQRAPEPVKYDMKTRAGRRAFEKALRKEQQQKQREQKVPGFPSIANTAKAFIHVMYEIATRA